MADGGAELLKVIIRGSAERAEAGDIDSLRFLRDCALEQIDGYTLTEAERDRARAVAVALECELERAERHKRLWRLIARAREDQLREFRLEVLADG